MIHKRYIVSYTILEDGRADVFEITKTIIQAVQAGGYGHIHWVFSPYTRSVALDFKKRRMFINFGPYPEYGDGEKVVCSIADREGADELMRFVAKAMGIYGRSFITDKTEPAP